MRPKVADSETLTGDLADLRAFCLVADLGSITASAQSLGETKGALSRRIARLERALGTALLRRGARKVSVTEEGAAFRSRVGAALDTLDEAAAEARLGLDAPRGLLRVTGPTDLGSILAPVISGFLEAHPAVRIELELTQTALDFETHRIDVAFRAAAALPDSALVAHRLRTLGIGFFAAPSYLRAHCPPDHPRALASHPMYAMRFGGRVPRVTLRHPTEPEEVLSIRPVLLANDNGFVRDATVAGGGIGLLLAELAATEVAAGRLAPVLAQWQPVERGHIYLMHAALALLPAKVRAFREHAQRTLGGGQRQF